MGDGFTDKYPVEGVSFLDICREFLDEIEKREAGNFEKIPDVGKVMKCDITVSQKAGC